MPVTITITADSGPLAAREMANMISEVGKSYMEMANGKTAAAAPAKVAEKPAPAAEAKVEEKEEPAKEEKKAKAKKPKPGEDDGSDVEETLDGCRIMAKRVAASDGKDGTAGGITKANKIIESFGVAQLSKIDEKDFAAFIEKCQETLDEAKAEPAKEAKPTARFD